MFSRRRGPLEELAHRLTELLDAATFQRGLALGALIGAAIAGSTIWRRIQEARSGDDASPHREEPGSD